MSRRERVPPDIAESMGWRPDGFGSSDGRGFFIVSVQSQKGGVGKSTAALALADLLCSEEKYSVLVIDADITGTNLGVAVENSLWSDRVNVVRTRGDDAARFDLAAYFVRDYLSGAPLPSFQNGSDGIRLTVDPGVPNIVGSSFPFARRPDSIEARAQFNEFFSTLFIEYIEGMARSFHKAVGEEAGARTLDTAIIIDNSPGHVGIVGELEDLLTDIGPHAAKFLFVTTTDIQDFEAVARSASSVFSRLQQKWHVAEAYEQLKNSETTGDDSRLDRDLLDGDAGQFFLALAERDARLEETPSSRASARDGFGALDFYLQRVVPSDRESLVAEPSRSIAGLFNLVPETLLEEIKHARPEKLAAIFFDGDRADGVPESQDLDTASSILGLLGSGASGRFVQFDPSIRDQYMSRAYTVVSGVRDVNLRQLEVVLSRLAREAQPLGGEQDGLRYGSMRAIVRAVDLSNRAVDALALHGSAYGRGLVRSGWLPSAILILLRDLSHSVLPELELEITTRDFEELADRSAEVRHRATELAQWLNKRMGSESSGPRLDEPATRLIAEAFGLAVEVAAHKGIPFGDTRVYETALAIAHRQQALVGLQMPEQEGSSHRVGVRSRYLGLLFRQELSRLEAELDPPP